MSATAEELLSAVLALPQEDRVEFLEVILASLGPTDRVPFDESWREVIERRSLELRTGAVKPVSWSEVKGKAQEQAVI